MSEFKKTHLLLFFAGVLNISGCSKKFDNWYTIEVMSKGNITFYDISFSKAIIPSSGTLNKESPYTSGGNAIPLPDDVTITWKTALAGGERHLAELDRKEEEYIKFLNEHPNEKPPYDPWEDETPIYPSNLFQEHFITIKLDKIPKKGFYGKIIFTFTDKNTVKMTFQETGDPFKKK